MITSQKTNSLEHFPLDIPPKELAEILNDRVLTPERVAELKQLSKTLLADRPVKSVALLCEEVLANIADPVKAAECAKDWAISFLKDLNDNPEFKFTPGVIADLRQVADFFRANQQQLTKQNDRHEHD